MPETTSFIQEGVDRVREVYDSLGGELQRVQKELHLRRKRLGRRLDAGRRDLEKAFDTQRKHFEKRTQKLRGEIEKNRAVKRLDALRRDAGRQLEQGITGFLNALQIASKSDVQRMDRKISALNKKVAEMHRRPKRSNASADASA